MAHPRITSSLDCDALLNEASARNLPIELHMRDGQHGSIVARGRVLAVDDKQVLVDRPQVIGRALDLEIGTPVDAFLCLAEELYRFKTTIVKPRLYVELNLNKSVVGVALARPSGLDSGQRRDYYRALLVGSDPVAVQLHAGERSVGNPCSTIATRYAGQLVDLSLGGAAVKVNDAKHARFALNDPLYLSFTLPDSTDQHILLAQVRQSRDLPETGNTRIGLQFIAWPDLRHLEAERNIFQRFITRVQREHLRRAG